jgi:hypothetical protein
VVTGARYLLPLTVLVCALAGCTRGESAEAGAPAPVPEPRWRGLGSWSGNGNVQTESFTVESGALRLEWETRNERAPGAGRFRISLHSAISGRPLQTIVDRTGIGAGTAYAEDEPRVSYLVIESSGLEWTATLDEALPTGGGESRPPR